MVLSSKKRAVTALLVNISRLLLAAVLLVSGFVKAVDPMGLSYKLGDYAAAFGVVDIDDGWLLFASAMLSAAEFILGVLLLMGVYKRVVTVLVFVFFLFFTPFTFILALWNPVRDCGCFGDAFTMSNWATFGKNIVLFLFATLCCFKRRLFVRKVSVVNRWMVLLFAICYISLLEGAALTHLPVIDFRPFYIGSDLRAAVEDIPAVHKYIYRFEKGGQVMEFDEFTYPDSTWNYLGSQSLTIEMGKPAKVSDFAFLDADGEDYAPQILADTGYVCLLVMSSIEKADESRVDKINDMYDYCLEKKVPFYAASSSDEDMIEEWRRRTGAEYSVLWADEVMLKTIVRANPGMLLLKDGIVVGKWNVADLPPVEKCALSSTGMPDKARSIYNYIRGWNKWIVLFVVPLFIIMFIDLVTAAVKWFFHYFSRDAKSNDVSGVVNGENSTDNNKKETIDLNNNTNL